MRWGLYLKIWFIIATTMKVCMFVFMLLFGISSFKEILGTRSWLDDKQSDEFRSWMEKHNKIYRSDEEFRKRKEVFKNNQIEIESLNAKHHHMDVQFGLNNFADLTHEEFREKILMPKRQPVIFPKSRQLRQNNLASIPNEFDWTSKGAVGPVRDQGSAGTCWAFSAVQTIEGQWALKTGKVLELSVEQVIDCDGMHDTKHADCGVFGGWPYLAYQYLEREGGIETEADYSYCCGLGGDKGTCYVCPAVDYNKTLCGPPPEYCKLNDSCLAKIDSSKFVPDLKLKGWSSISKNETAIANALVSEGPLSVLINSGTLQFYKRGVWDPLICDPNDLDHAVLLTGYGTTKTAFGEKKYWKVKNSWGKKWGEDGYFRIARNKGKCGINTQVTIVHL